MSQTAILWPMIAHVALVFIIYMLLGWRRRTEMQSGSVRPDQFKLNRQEPDASAVVANNLANQFELPVLFHAGCLALFTTGGVSLLTAGLAWLFVLLRYVHAYVHVTSNDLRLRSPVFAAGFVVLAALWAVLALNLARAP